jgi:hypothetical protein
MWLCYEPMLLPSASVDDRLAGVLLEEMLSGSHIVTTGCLLALLQEELRQTQSDQALRASFPMPLPFLAQARPQMVRSLTGPLP